MDNHDNLVSDFAEAFEFFTEFATSDATLADLDRAIAHARATAIVRYRERNRDRIAPWHRSNGNGQS